MVAARTGITGSELVYAYQGGELMLLTRAQVTTLLAATAIPSYRPFTRTTKQTGDEQISVIQGGQPVLFTRADFIAYLAATGRPDPITPYKAVTSITGNERIVGVQGGQPTAFSIAEMAAIAGGTFLSPTTDVLRDELLQAQTYAGVPGAGTISQGGGGPTIPPWVNQRMIFTGQSNPSFATFANSSSFTQFQEKSNITTMNDFRYVKIRFQNVFGNLGTIQAGGSQITIRCSLNIPGVTDTISGVLDSDRVSRDMVLQPDDWGDFYLDCGQVVPAGSVVSVVRRIIFANAPSNWPATDIKCGSTAYQEAGNNLPDRTTGARWSTGSALSTQQVLTPIAMWTDDATIATVGVSVFGDSIVASGDNDTTGSNGPNGFTQRAFNVGCGWMTNGGRGLQLLSLMASSASLRRRLTAIAGTGYSHVFCGLGTNDIGVNQTYAQLKANYDSLNTMVRATGMKFIPMTLFPRTDSTNTTFNSSGGAGSWTARTAFNNYIRTNPYGDGYYDCALSTEAGSTNLWRTDLGSPTTDGIHPNTIIHTQCRTDLLAAIPTLFVR